MRQIARSLLLASLALGAFCYWGAFTTGGRQEFDEMSGIIPLFAGVLASGAAGSGALLYFVAWKRARRSLVP